jgi:cell division protease FtsH
MHMKRLTRGPIIWILLAFVLVIVATQILSGSSGPEEIDTGQAVTEIEQDKVKKAELIDGEQRLNLTLTDDTEQTTQYITGQGVELQNQLQTKVAEGKLSDGYNVSVPDENLLVTLLISFLPILLILGLLFFFMSQMQGGGGKLMSFGKSKAKAVSKDMPKTTFADVAGADEAVEELQEVKDFLEDPAKYQALGAKIPKGVLLYGPPGTGKTLLARAVAGEAEVPFFAISGSDFVEMFVGVGASRVRDLFSQAKENAPAIIFIDEIDAVGRHRGAGMGGGHDEREQTLNQMLVEMDGFDTTGGVILIAATNRPDILDPALLRPGRFDRQIGVERPDIKGRTQILKVHASGKPLADNVDLESIAKRSPGFTGADLANVLNEAALLTARLGEKQITDANLDEAIDRVMAGPQKRTRVMDEHERKVTAYHEGGHAIVAAALPNNDPVHKITIMPRGRALGYTMVLPEEERYSTTRSEMLNQLAYMLGGRAAEELVYHDPTTGAANDIEKATSVARAMVTQYGMTERLGAIRYGKDDGEVFVGMEMGHRREFSEEVAAAIDEEVRALIEEAHQEAYDILVGNRDVLDHLVLELLARETLGKNEVKAIFEALDLRKDRPAWTGSARRAPSTRPPVLSAKEISLAEHPSPNGSRSSEPESEPSNARSAPAEAGRTTSASDIPNEERGKGDGNSGSGPAQWDPPQGDGPAGD